MSASDVLRLCFRGWIRCLERDRLIPPAGYLSREQLIFECERHLHHMTACLLDPRLPEYLRDETPLAVHNLSAFVAQLRAADEESRALIEAELREQRGRARYASGPA